MYYARCFQNVLTTGYGKELRDEVIAEILMFHYHVSLDLVNVCGGGFSIKKARLFCKRKPVLSQVQEKLKSSKCQEVRKTAADGVQRKVLGPEYEGTRSLFSNPGLSMIFHCASV